MTSCIDSINIDKLSLQLLDSLLVFIDNYYNDDGAVPSHYMW